MKKQGIWGLLKHKHQQQQSNQLTEKIIDRLISYRSNGLLPPCNKPPPQQSLTIWGCWHTLIWQRWMVKMACERELWAFIWVLAVVRDRAPSFRHCNSCSTHTHAAWRTFGYDFLKKKTKRQLGEQKRTITHRAVLLDHGPVPTITCSLRGAQHPALCVLLSQETAHLPDSKLQEFLHLHLFTQNKKDFSQMLWAFFSDESSPLLSSLFTLHNLQSSISCLTLFWHFLSSLPQESPSVSACLSAVGILGEFNAQLTSPKFSLCFPFHSVATKKSVHIFLSALSPLSPLSRSWVTVLFFLASIYRSPPLKSPPATSVSPVFHISNNRHSCCTPDLNISSFFLTVTNDLNPLWYLAISQKNLPLKQSGSGSIVDQILQSGITHTK